MASVLSSASNASTTRMADGYDDVSSSASFHEDTRRRRRRRRRRRPASCSSSWRLLWVLGIFVVTTMTLSWNNDISTSSLSVVVVMAFRMTSPPFVMLSGRSSSSSSSSSSRRPSPAASGYVFGQLHNNDNTKRSRRSSSSSSFPLQSTTTSSATSSSTSTNFTSSSSSSSNAGYRHDQPYNNHNNNDQKYNISLLIIDHYDSFTYNLYDYFAQLTVEPPLVIAKDAYDEFIVDDWQHIDGIVLSPGPGTPHEQPALSHQAISQNAHLPLLGVCLGHQLLALHYGARVDTAPIPIHGQDHWISTTSTTTTTTSEMTKYGGGAAAAAAAAASSSSSGSTDVVEQDDKSSTNHQLFQGLPSSFRVVRYHSLAAYDLPSDGRLQVTARSHGDNVIQAMQHVEYPHYGVQFHPESIGTQHGMALLDNFCQIVQEYKNNNKNNKTDPQQEQRLADEKDDNINIVSSSSQQQASNDGPTLLLPMPSSSSNDDDNMEMPIQTPLPQPQPQPPRFRVVAHPFTASGVLPEQVFETLYSSESHSMWLDSSSASTARGTVDIMAAPLSQDDIIEYYHHDHDDDDDDEQDPEEEGKPVMDILTRLEQELFLGASKTDSMGHRRPASHELAILHQLNDDPPLVFEREDDHAGDLSAASLLPFHYRGGFLGYLGYEVRYDTERYLHHVEGGRTTGHRRRRRETKRSTISSDTPTAAFFLARNSVVYHHPTETFYTMSLLEEDQPSDDILEWMKTTKEQILGLISSPSTTAPPSTASVTSPSKKDQPAVSTPLRFTPNRSKATYEKDIAQCHEFIRQGESYELCLTNQLEAFLRDDDDSSPRRRSTWDLYKILRRRNPAPYSAFFRWNNHWSSDASSHSNNELSICCSSPERFMSVQRKQLHPPDGPIILQAEAKPIKGTEARVMPQKGAVGGLTEAEQREDERRARSLELSLKNRAENLMIVDLLRNDLSRVCQVGSVHVAKLMAIESFATVHQMVSTIRGTLATLDPEHDDETRKLSSTTSRSSSTSIDLLRAAFPGGSMTGAPKIRTMELLEELEQNVDRGPYAGSLGYLSVNGCMDMNIIIRSAVLTNTRTNDADKKQTGQRVRIGAGGAITALSETQDEYEEMLLKARAVVEAVQEWAAA